MAVDIINKALKLEFEEVLQTNDPLEIRQFLDQQNISDVADLVYDYEDYESKIIAGMSVHRAAGVFRILDVSTQKRIIQNLPPSKTAELLNELPADDRTSFLEELPSNAVRELIKLLDNEERKITLSLLGYPENHLTLHLGKVLISLCQLYEYIKLLLCYDIHCNGVHQI